MYSLKSRPASRNFAPGLPRTVIALGLVSFFTDLSSEMIYPLLPLFLAGVLGAGVFSLGLIEGVAETTAALLKVFSGFWSDRIRRRKPLVLAGYSLSGLARPLIGMASVWPFVLLMRFADRVGKGVRSTPRDALIADVTDPSMRGRAYGLHRAMDHAGAVAGPLVAAGLLAISGVTLRHVFLIAAVPAAIAVVFVITAVKEPPPRGRVPRQANFRDGWGDLGLEFKHLLFALIVFTLGNSTDAFLLLRLAEQEIDARLVAVLWSLHHVVKMAATYTGGRLSDRTGRRGMVVAGWLLYAAVYLAFGFVQSRTALVAVFLVYGLYFGLTEPTEKAWVADLVPERLRGTAFGFYNGCIGLTALPASLIFGLLWKRWGVAAAFSTGAGLAVIAAILLLLVRRRV
jgi:MFS family permease